MIKVIYNKETDEFLAKGTISLGKFENKDYDGTEIQLGDTLDDLLSMVDTGEYADLLGKLYPILQKGKRDGDSVALLLQEYYNDKIEELNRNIKQFNDLIWAQLFKHLMDIDGKFWKNENALAHEYRGQDWEEEVMRLYQDKQDEIYAILEDYTNWSANNGTIQKADVEKKMWEYFYMFNFDGLVESIVHKFIVFSYRFMAVEFSDNWGSALFHDSQGSEVFSSALAELDEDFSLHNWDNF